MSTDVVVFVGAFVIAFVIAWAIATVGLNWWWRR